jgi:Peptidase family C25
MAFLLEVFPALLGNSTISTDSTDPLPTVSRLFIHQTGSKSVIRWTASSETHVLAYEIQILLNGHWIRATSDPIPAQKNPAESSYEIADIGEARQSDHYRIAAYLDNGTITNFSEISTATSDLFRMSNALPVKKLMPAIRQKLNSRVTSHPKPAATPLPLNLTASKARVRIGTTNQGIHHLTASSLASLLGQSPATVENWITTGTLAMSSGGQSVAYIPGHDLPSASGGSETGLYFYAESNRNNYTSENVYWLTAGTNSYTVEDAGNPPPAAPGLQVATSQNEIDDPNLSILAYLSDPEADYWMWKNLVYGAAPRNATAIIPFLLANPAPGHARLIIDWFGGSQLPHLVSAIVNGHAVGTPAAWSGIAPYRAIWDDIPGEWLQPGTNYLSVKILGTRGVALDAVYLNRFSVEYPQTLIADRGYLEAQLQSRAPVSASGFATDRVSIFNISSPKSPSLVRNPGTRTIGLGNWEMTLIPSSQTNRYVFVEAGATGAVLTPSSLELRYSSNLRDSSIRASYIAVAPSKLIECANRLAAMRDSRLRTKVVALEDVYDEFSAGRVTPHAIQDFVRWAALHWDLPPRYLVLVGDGTYDYRNLKQYGDNLVPPLLVATDFGLFSSDSLFGDVNGDGLPCISVGRFPVHTPDEFDAMAAKISAYESQAFPSLRSLLIADQSPDPNGAGDFAATVGQLAFVLNPRYQTTSVSPPSYLTHPELLPSDYLSIRASIQSEWNKGVDLVSYVGHGSYSSWGSGMGYLSVNSDNPNQVGLALTNLARLPIVTAMTCVAGQYSNPGYTSLMEALVMQNNGGAIATLAPTGLSHHDDSSFINERLTEQFKENRSTRLGDIVLQAFCLYQSSKNPKITSLWIYNLLGDPALNVFSP